MPQQYTHDETIRLAVRKLINRINSKPQHMQTPTSIRYRRRASALAKQADIEQDPEKLAKLLHECLTWIQIAENEELLADGGNHGPC